MHYGASLCVLGASPHMFRTTASSDVVVYYSVDPGEPLDLLTVIVTRSHCARLIVSVPTIYIVFHVLCILSQGFSNTTSPVRPAQPASDVTYGVQRGTVTIVHSAPNNCRVATSSWS